MEFKTSFELELSEGRGKKKRDFSLQVDFASSDERIVIFGPSGCGKSLTLRVIAGLIKPQRGYIRLGERVLYDSEAGVFVPPQQRRIAYVFQDYALFPHLSVLENVSYSMRRWPLPLGAESRERALAMLDDFGIADLAHSLPQQLSGGQRQRVALVRALLSEPELILLDEPFAALDVMLRTKMREEMLAIQERFKVPLVMISHDLEDVKSMAQTLLVFQKGSIADIIEYRSLCHELGQAGAWKQALRACRAVFFSE